MSACSRAAERLFAESTGAHQQVIALRDTRRARSSLAIERDRGLSVTGTLQQMCTYRGQPMVAGKSLVLVERFEQRQSGTGPSTIAVAMAWLSSTTGLSDIRRSTQ